MYVNTLPMTRLIPHHTGHREGTLLVTSDFAIFARSNEVRACVDSTSIIASGSFLVEVFFSCSVQQVEKCSIKSRLLSVLLGSR